MKDVTTGDYQTGRSFKSALIFNLILIIGVTVYMVFSGNSGSVIAQINEDAMGVAANGTTIFIDLADVTEVNLVYSIDIGEAQQEETESKVYSGKYENSEYGTFDLLAYKNSESFIVVHHSGGVLVYSLKTEKLTQSSYEELMKNTGL